MKHFIVIIFLALVIAGCASGSGNVDPYVQQLQWLDAADPQKDAQQALKKGDFRLLGLVRVEMWRSANRGYFRCGTQ